MNLYVLIVEMVIERWNHYDYSLCYGRQLPNHGYLNQEGNGCTDRTGDD